MKHFFYSLLLVTFQTALLAQPGALDMAFAGDGKAILAPSQSIDECEHSLSLPDGKTLLAGYSFSDVNYQDAYALMRLNPDGVTFDHSFGEKGIVRISAGDNYAQIYGLSVGEGGEIMMILEIDGQAVIL